MGSSSKKRWTPATLYSSGSPRPLAEDLAFTAAGRHVDRDQIPRHRYLVQAATHVNGVYTYTFADEQHAVLTGGTWMSLPVDFFIKSTGLGDFFPGTGKRLPIIHGTRFDTAIAARVLVLSCLTTHYTDLWSTQWSDEMRSEAWAKDDHRLPADFYATLTSSWHRGVALRSDFARRQALVELDVIVAMALGITLEQLLDIYRIQFPVLQQNERDTWYDRTGRIAFTSSSGLPGVGLPARRRRRGDPGDYWEDVADPAAFAGTLSKTFEDDTLPGGPHERTIVYQGPFDRCDREADYRQAWEVFSKRFGTGGEG